jgi:hypothetical protein
MVNKLALYCLTVALLAMAVYLHSPLVAVMSVVLWAVDRSESVLTRKNRDADIVGMLDTLNAHKAKMDTLSRDVTNVAERARTILGENF